MTYEEARDIVVKSYRRGSKGGFGICAGVLRELGDPHKRLKVIHVAGTNGKGSSCAFLRSILTEAGYKTGMFTSPHLFRFNERFNIDGAEISDADFADLVDDVCRAFKQAFGRELYGEAEVSEGPSVSYFELLTLMAFHYFDKENVDAAIMETGMGGRQDATNITPSPILTVITNISLDHTTHLGGTIAAITREKAGIIKKNSRLVLYSQSREVYNIATETCHKRNAPLYYGGAEWDGGINVIKNDVTGVDFSVNSRLNGRPVVYNNLRLNMFGEYQIYNAAGTLIAVEALRDAGFHIDDGAVSSGLEGAKWPGRMEIVARSPLTVLDGAHNPGGAYYVKRARDVYFRGKKVILVVGVLKDKDYHSVVNTLAQAADYVILTSPAYAVKATPTAELYEALDDKKKVAGVINDYKQAYETAKTIAGPDGVVLVSGSLYLVGDLREYLLGHERLN